MKSAVVTSAELLRRLRELDPRALLRQSTWQKLLLPERAAKGVPAIGVTNRTGTRSSLPGGVTSLRIDEPNDWPDLPPLGLRQSGSQRVWTIPLWVHYSQQTRVGRLATVAGQVVLSSAEMTTAADQVPGLVGLMTANGEWASGDPPAWQPVAEEDAEAEFTAAEDGGPAPRLLATLNAGVLAVYVRRPDEFVRF